MARLTETQLKREVEREKQKQETIKKKMEIQQKKELYGENWRQVEQERFQNELDLVDLNWDITWRFLAKRHVFLGEG